MDELLSSFLLETNENLTRLDSEIVQLERDPTNRDLLASIFRTIHTIKGTCGFIGLARLGKIAHHGEDVLGKMRDGVLIATPDAISLVLEAVDLIKLIVAELEATGGQEPTGDDSALVRRLDALANAGALPPLDEQAPDDFTPDEAAVQTVGASPHQAGDAPEIGLAAAGAVPEETDVSFDDPAPEVAAAALAPVEAPAPAESAPSTARAAASSQTSPPDQGKSSVADLTVRVHVDVLDRLMNLVGELVLGRNQLLQMTRGQEDSRFTAPVQHLNRVTSDLQEGVMKTRMQPIGNAWANLPRLVRDLSCNAR